MKQDSGVILVNVLVVLAIGSAITVLMFTSQDTLLDRTTRSAAAVQAEALTLGAETSIVLALKRDMITAPETDHFAESWTIAAQQDVALATGQFSITISDAQSRFDLNGLASSGVLQSQIFVRLIRDLGLPDSVANTVITHMTQRGPITQIDEISGLSKNAVNILRPHVIASPLEVAINLNTANVTVMGAVLGNPAAARQLVKTRDRNGFLTQGDLTDVGVLTAGGAGFTSQLFDVTTRAEVDSVSVTLVSRILRRTEVGFNEVVVISRNFGE